MLIHDEMNEEKWQVFNQAIVDVSWYLTKFHKIKHPCEAEMERAERAQKLLPECGIDPSTTKWGAYDRIR